jgi:hypothetical protein
MAYSNGRSCAHRTAGQVANHSTIERGNLAAFIMATALAFLSDDRSVEGMARQYTGMGRREKRFVVGVSIPSVT